MSMRFAIISDIHGNLEAFQQVLAEIETRHVDEIISLGDIVGYYPNPVECIELLQQNNIKSVLGNHDCAAIGREDFSHFSEYAYHAMVWTRQNLPEWAKRYLSSLPMRLIEHNILFTHASPQQALNWNYLFPTSFDEVHEAFEQTEYTLNFVGHTHVPICFSLHSADNLKTFLQPSTQLQSDVRYVINVGSVGQPRDRDPRACYFVYDVQSKTLDVHRVSYNYGKTQQKIADCSLPSFLAKRLSKGQ